MNDVFTSEVSVDNSSDLSDLEDLSGKELLERLEGSHDEVIDDLFLKKVFVAVSSDFCHFIHHTLRASEKGWLTMCYSLLRKPFQENLLILEWLLADPEEFLEVFREKEIKNHAPSGGIGEDKAREHALQQQLQNHMKPSTYARTIPMFLSNPVVFSLVLNTSFWLIILYYFSTTISISA